MTEKEERILVLKATEDDFIYKHFNGKGFIPRQEAIEKMAKALFNFQYDGGLSFEYAYDGAKKEFRLFAKAALNALLEDK